MINKLSKIYKKNMISYLKRIKQLNSKINNLKKIFYKYNNKVN